MSSAPELVPCTTAMPSVQSESAHILTLREAVMGDLEVSGECVCSPLLLLYWEARRGDIASKGRFTLRSSVGAQYEDPRDAACW